MSVIVRSANKTAYVYRNGVVIRRAGIPNLLVILPLNDLSLACFREEFDFGCELHLHCSGVPVPRRITSKSVYILRSRLRVNIAK
jgi:hypothetical protein